MNIKRLLPVLALVALIVAAFAFHLDRYLTLDFLRQNRAQLSAYVAEHGLAARLGYVIAYAGVVALSLPGAAIMTLAGGFLFGVLVGATLTVIGATLGATLLFLVARSAVGDSLRERAGPFLARMAEGFSKNAFSYLLFLRLVPAFPRRDGRLSQGASGGSRDAGRKDGSALSQPQRLGDDRRTGY